MHFYSSHHELKINYYFSGLCMSFLIQKLLHSEIRQFLIIQFFFKQIKLFDSSMHLICLLQIIYYGQHLTKLSITHMIQENERSPSLQRQSMNHSWDWVFVIKLFKQKLYNDFLNRKLKKSQLESSHSHWITSQFKWVLMTSLIKWNRKRWAQW